MTSPRTVHLHRVLKAPPERVYRELSIAQAGVPDMIPLEMCYLGWQESLAQLAHLVEPVIPG